MKGNDFLEKISLIDPAYIEAADALPRVKKFSKLKRFTLVAACIVLIFAAGFGTYVAASEIKEYKDAVEFFENYDLSTEGLTREEIKKVYRDITTKSFSYSKTAEVILSSISNDKIGGFEILQEDPTPEDLENIWDIKKHNESIFTPQDSTSQNPTPQKSNITYRERYEYDGLGSKTHLEKLEGNKLIWSVYVPEFNISGHIVVSDGIIVYGETDRRSSEQPEYPWIAKLDENGNILWKQRINDEFHTEFITHVLENADGSYAVISRGDFNYFCLSQYTADGKKILYTKTNVGYDGIQNVARFGDGYIVQLGGRSELAKIVKVDYEGNITESFSYTSKDSYYYITDMIEFDNKIYLSAYAVPRYSDKEHKDEWTAFFDYLDFNNYGKFTSDEERTLAYKGFYTAILLVCDPSSGTPQEFYSVKGSLGGKLALSDSGNLLWDVERLTSTFYSPATSSFTIGGTCHVFRYTFNSNGLIINQEKTGETTIFRR